MEKIAKKENLLGEYIRSKRETLGMKQGELARKVGVAVPTISLYEAGKRTPDLETLRKIAGAINTNLASLIRVEVPENSLEVALRAENLTGEDIDKIKAFIDYVKHKKEMEKDEEQE